MLNEVPFQAGSLADVFVQRVVRCFSALHTRTLHSSPSIKATAMIMRLRDEPDEVGFAIISFAREQSGKIKWRRRASSRLIMA